MEFVVIEDVENVICLGPEQRRPESVRPLLVVVVAIPTPTLAFMQSIHSLREALQSLGLDSIIINNVEFVALVDQPRTFLTAKNPGDKGCKVIADGVEQRYVMWAELISGLVCLRESGNPANLTVKRFNSVVFE
ncbi:MAG: hypothetical protein U0930_03760 [Pirellulales bacterium]